MSTVSPVTGGNRGIGREVRARLAVVGHTVPLRPRSLQAATDAARRPTRDGGDVRPPRPDVTDDATGRAGSRGRCRGGP